MDAAAKVMKNGGERDSPSTGGGGGERTVPTSVKARPKGRREKGTGGRVKRESEEMEGGELTR
jgi:hypothetical protein